MLPDIQPGNTKILYFFNCLLDGMHTTLLPGFSNVLLHSRNFQATDMAYLSFRELTLDGFCI